MEPVDILRKDKETMDALRVLRERIYRKVADFSVEYSPSKEPVDYSEHFDLSYKTIKKGKSWGELYGCSWFRLDVDIREEDRKKNLRAHIDIGGEGLVYDRNKGMDPIGAVTLETSIIDRYQALESKTYVDIPYPIPSHLSWDIDAGFNGYYNNLTGKGWFRCAEIVEEDRDGLDFYYDYLTIAALAATKEGEEKENLKALLALSLNRSQESWEEGREVLKPLFNGKRDKDLTLYAVGHSHLDLAWLWPLRETKRKAERTFTHQLRNLSRYDSYVYGASQPQQFEFVKEHNPLLYERIKDAIEGGRFEVQGPMWVEADNNIPSAESLIRQIIYGKKFWKEEFGKESHICWLPDVFGYNGNMPQILKKCGIPYFMTIKLSWNEHNSFPSRSFVWEGIDGSSVLVHMPPAETYNAAASPLCAKAAKDHYPELGLSDKALLLYGIGDGGGGPSEVHIEMGKRQMNLENSPRIHFSTAESFFTDLEKDREKLPVFKGELYLEKHQGTYTSQSFNKKSNRRCEENMLALEELDARFGKTDSSLILERLWKRILLLEFHDILPGSSINRVYKESREEYLEILEEIETEENKLLPSEDDGRYMLYNPSPYSSVFYKKIDGVWMKGFIPSHGSSFISPTEDRISISDHLTFSNGLITVTFDEDGRISSLKTKDREWKKEKFNSLVVYYDPQLYYNAWDIDWEYWKKKGDEIKWSTVSSFSDGPLSGVELYGEYNNSQLRERIFILPDNPVLYFSLSVSWHECHKMLRVEFEPTVWSDKIRCEIQDGVMERSTKNESDVEKAQFEICARRYATVHDNSGAFSIINDSKYGLRAKDGKISLNLLRSPVFPDESADRGDHTIIYGILPDEENDLSKPLVFSSLLNRAPILYKGEKEEKPLAYTHNTNIALDSIKKSIDGKGIVLRLYEGIGRETEEEIEVSFPYTKVEECNMVEEERKEIKSLKLSFSPFEIKTLYFRVS